MTRKRSLKKGEIQKDKEVQEEKEVRGKKRRLIITKKQGRQRKKEKELINYYLKQPWRASEGTTMPKWYHRQSSQEREAVAAGLPAQRLPRVGVRMV